MPIKSDSEDEVDSQDWDCIVVGAGAVGLVLAVTLARSSLRVLVLESGDRDVGPAQSLNDAVQSGRHHDGISAGRARVVGGTTTLWGGQLAAFTPFDFERRELLPDSVWPIRYGDVAQFYREAAKLLGLDATHFDDSSLWELHGRNSQGDDSGLEIFFTRWLKEPNLAKYFFEDLANLPNLRVAPKHHVTEILCEANEATISGVKVSLSGGVSKQIRANVVVLACGTIEISKLLLLTARKTPSLKWAQNPNIGCFFHDHLDLVIGSVVPRDKKLFSNLFENIVIQGLKYQPKLRYREAIIRSEGTLNLACSVSFDSSLSEDIQLLKQVVRSLRGGTRVANPMKAVVRIAGLCKVWFPLMWRYVKHRRVMAFADRGIRLTAHCEQLTVRDSRITLSDGQRDAFGDPVVCLHWQIDEAVQLKALSDFARRVKTFMDSTAQADVAIAPELLRNDQGVLQNARDSYHQGGGACMAESGGLGVVDRDCKVFGAENLYVAGAAVFPSGSYANPTFTAMALALRLSKRLIADRASSSV